MRAICTPGIFASDLSNIDAGLATPKNDLSGSTLNAYINVKGAYVFTGWTNLSQTYYCGDHIAVFFGILDANTGVLIVGIPDEDPTQQQLPPTLIHLDPASWNFFALNSREWYHPGTWQGNPTICDNCVTKRMTSIAFGSGHDYNNDTSCFGACNGTTTNWWDQEVMGQLIQPCDQVPQKSAECTIQYFTDGRWNGGGIQEEPAGIAQSYSPSGTVNQFQEGISLTFYGSHGKHIQQSGPWHKYATPSPGPTFSPPPHCGGSMLPNGQSVSPGIICPCPQIISTPCPQFGPSDSREPARSRRSRRS